MMTEIYKDIKDLEGLYKVSNFGRVKSLGNGKSYNSKERILKPDTSRNGYLKVLLYKDGKKKKFLVHRLVAEAFIPNPNNLPCVNHKDEDKTNNYVGTPENDYMDGNLEWCSHEYNINYGTRNERSAKARINGKKSKRVLQFTLDGELIREWPSISECGRNGFCIGNICECCQGKLKSHKGYIWRYKE